MNVNFLLLNERKTNFVEFVPPLNVNSVISALDFSEAEALFPCESIKTLGVLFDYKLNLSDQLDRVVSICYSNFRNLGKIASKLSAKFKIQLIHSMILFLFIPSGLILFIPSGLLQCFVLWPASLYVA